MSGHKLFVTQNVKCAVDAAIQCEAVPKVTALVVFVRLLIIDQTKHAE